MREGALAVERGLALRFHTRRLSARVLRACGNLRFDI
jgi:hypothetical protein